ncbi:T9SS type A sorting domain-containing protein [Formosa maritima]|uniref:T9SS type A sorting domain-containing protein n=2 Tax=Formosa maritima TaxID=2592046 RepID=A0A5D0GG01_9FLAO|nr:T9SS type A sorting domain-containing protein [Formosa maritima]
MTYTVEYTTSDSECASSSIQDVTVLPAEDASFTMTPTCDGATAEITGDTGGTFAFNPEPGDGATIDSETGTVTGGSLGSTYTIEYTTSGPCPATTSQTISVEDLENPVAMCNNMTVMLDSNGMYVLTEEDINALGMDSTDNCGIESITVSTNSFTCDDIGDVTITLTVTDFGGNTSTCEAIITIDGEIPTVEITETPLSVFCQGVTLTAESPGTVTYLWSTGETTESIVVFENGTYGLTVTSETNCSSYIEYTVSSIEEGTPISEYAIFASNEVYLHGNNVVQSGGVGVGSLNGEIKLHQNSHISEFGQATTFTLNQGSTINNQINDVANPILPNFIYNTLSNSASPSVTISNGDTQTLDGDVYDQIWVREGATVIFSQPNVYVNRIKTSEDANIEFAGCTNVYVNSLFMLAKYGTINSYGNSVTFYVNNDIHVEKGSNVHATMYSNSGQILAKGSNVNSNNPEPTYMTGLFIANKVHGLNNVFWNADVICNPCQGTEPDGGRINNFDVTSWPNPSDTVFNLRLITEDLMNNATIEVFDMNNKLVHTNKFRPEQAYSFGSRLDGGVYIVKISQANNTKIIRLVKF